MEAKWCPPILAVPVAVDRVVVLAHGSNDEYYQFKREDLEALIRSGADIGGIWGEKRPTCETPRRPSGGFVHGHPSWEWSFCAASQQLVYLWAR